MDEISEAYAKFEAAQVAGGRVCGSCELFTDKDFNGNGECQFHQGQRHCGSTCRHWNKRT